MQLLGGFALHAQQVGAVVPPAAQRLIAFLALCDRAPLRPAVAGRLWPDASEDQALASLRSTLWRLRRLGCALVDARAGRLDLADGLRVDVRDVVARARRILDHGVSLAPGDDDPAPLCGELLPGWWDDWIVLERERLRQLQLHALERLAERLADAGCFAGALEAALQAVACEPLRESAHRAVVAIHLAEGNFSEARRARDAYCETLRTELGVRPSPCMERLLDVPPA